MKAIEEKSNTSWKGVFVIDTILAIFITSYGFLIYFHLLFDRESSELIISGLSIDHGFPSNQSFIWYLLNSIIMFVYLILVFITTLGKWRFLILPCIWYFPCNLLYMYTSVGLNNYWDYVFSIPGIISILLILSLILLLDNLFKRYILINSIELTLNQTISEIFSSWNKKLNYQIEIFLANKPSPSSREYLIGVYYIYELVEKLIKGGSTNSSELGFQNKKKRNPSFLFVLIIVITSVFFFLEPILPSNSKTLNLGGIVLGNYGFDDVNTLVWYISQKVFVGSVLTIWFITTPYWWRWAILSPVIFYTCQFWEAFQSQTQIESAGNLKVFPLVLATITLVLMISRIVRTHCITMDYKAILERELDRGISELSKARSLPKKKTRKRKRGVSGR